MPNRFHTFWQFVQLVRPYWMKRNLPSAFARAIALARSCSPGSFVTGICSQPSGVGMGEAAKGLPGAAPGFSRA